MSFFRSARFIQALRTTVFASLIHPFLLTYVQKGEPFGMDAVIERAQTETPVYAVIFLAILTGWAWLSYRRDRQRTKSQTK